MQEGEQDPIRRSLEKALGGQHTILRLLGRGGMGAVYLARDTALERLVAIKVLLLDRGEDAASRERFRREARTAARLTHPNIVPLHGFGEADGMLYLVMGYVQGEPLSARMRQGARLGLTEARRIGAEIADALDHAHGRGVVHRDVKPDNILIDDETGRAMLADFGIAKALGAGAAVTQAGGVIGTPAYMSPEQAAGREELDGRSDLYSLGVVLYGLVAGRLPFEGKDGGDLLVKHLTQEPPALKSARADVPDDLAAAVMRCLAKDPEARFPDARRLREAIAPTGLDEEQLPEPLDGLDGVAPRMLPFVVVWLLSLWHLWVSSLTGQEPSAVGILLSLALGSFLVYQLPWLLSAIRLARRRSFSWSTIVGAILRQPAWWLLFWYPRAFRRPWDVWDRLPRSFRVFRGSATLLVANILAAMPIAMLLMRRIERAEAEQNQIPPLPIALPLLLATFFALALSLVVCLAFGARHVLGLGYDVYTRRVVASALNSGPTARRTLWKKPEIARALLPVRDAPPVLPSEPRLPRDYARAIARAGGGTAEADAFVSEIAAIDAEIERLSVDADAEEAARLRQKLAALGAEGAGDGDERRQRRRLLQEQIDLIARVESRLEAARSRRQARVDALRELWRSATTPAGGGTETAATRAR
jgi:serine/threonine protein kinase